MERTFEKDRKELEHRRAGPRGCPALTRGLGAGGVMAPRGAIGYPKARFTAHKARHGKDSSSSQTVFSKDAVLHKCWGINQND